MTAGHFELDQEFAAFDGITGIDEAGRGCLAGPVVIAAVTWNPEKAATCSWFPNLADSKQLDAKAREFLYPRVLGYASRIKVAVIGPALIDYLNILRATLHGFELVAPPPNANFPLLIDGNQKPPTLKYAKTIVKGDSRVSAISAAGIIAKVSRDRLMTHLARTQPQYHFEIHKGYATKKHREAIKVHGPGNMHRKSFRPVSDFDQESLPADDELIFDPKAPWALWNRIIDNYHRYSRTGCRKALEQLTRAGLGILPSARDPICTL